MKSAARSSLLYHPKEKKRKKKEEEKKERFERVQESEWSFFTLSSLFFELPNCEKNVKPAARSSLSSERKKKRRRKEGEV